MLLGLTTDKFLLSSIDYLPNSEYWNTRKQTCPKIQISYLLFCTAFIWRIFLEKKNSAGCLLQTMWLNIVIWQEKLCGITKTWSLVQVYLKVMEGLKCLFLTWWMCSYFCSEKKPMALPFLHINIGISYQTKCAFKHSIYIRTVKLLQFGSLYWFKTSLWAI